MVSNAEACAASIIEEQDVLAVLQSLQVTLRSRIRDLREEAEKDPGQPEIMRHMLRFDQLVRIR